MGPKLRSIADLDSIDVLAMKSDCGEENGSGFALAPEPSPAGERAAKTTSNLVP